MATGGYINDAGSIAGSYRVNDPTVPGLVHTYGFLLDVNQQFVTIAAPSAGTGFHQGTVVTAINSLGVLVGVSTDANYLNHGFVRAPDGTF